MKKQRQNSSYRFILRNSKISEELTVGQLFEINQKIEDDIFFQLTRVFRCQIGQEVKLLNPNYASRKSEIFTFKISNLNKRGIELELISKEAIEEKFDFDLELAFGTPNKPGKLDLILQKATELCASQIHVIQMERSQLQHQYKQDRMEKILIEASEQSERITIPKIIFHNSLNDFIFHLEKINKLKNLIIALERTEKDSDNILQIELSENPVVLIGPEGGISPNELLVMKEKGISTFNLGGSILRMETAVILSLGIIVQRKQSS